MKNVEYGIVSYYKFGIFHNYYKVKIIENYSNDLVVVKYIKTIGYADSYLIGTIKVFHRNEILGLKVVTEYNLFEKIMIYFGLMKIN